MLKSSPGDSAIGQVRESPNEMWCFIRCFLAIIDNSVNRQVRRLGCGLYVYFSAVEVFIINPRTQFPKVAVTFWILPHENKGQGLNP